MMGSAWIKWARAMEHQKVLARATREFRTVDSYEYVRTDNNGDRDDPLVRVHWQLQVKKPYPEQGASSQRETELRSRPRSRSSATPRSVSRP